MRTPDPSTLPTHPDLGTEPGDANSAATRPTDDAKLPYRRPRLVREGRVEEKTLQGFFGTFSP